MVEFPPIDYYAGDALVGALALADAGADAYARAHAHAFADADAHARARAFNRALANKLALTYAEENSHG